MLRLSLLRLLRWPIVAIFGILSLAGCGDEKQANPAASAPPPAVSIVKVSATEIRPTKTFTGRIEGKEKVELRARIEGFLEKRSFVEGANVKNGDVLFGIEKGFYQAAVDQAQATLLTAESTLKLAELDVDRQKQLFQRNVTAQATLDQATARQGEAQGNMLAQKAALEKAELQLSYTDMASPIDGRIGRASASVGNFVSPNSGVLATIVSQDPIYASFPVTQREILAVRKAQAANNGGEFVIYIQLADGSRYSSTGKIDFLDNTVNQGTDTVQVRSIFANPNGILVDGQLVTVVVETGKGESALLVPQQALQIDQTGPYVLVVDKDNKIQIRRVDIDGSRGADAVVTKGLEVNESVVTEGVQRVRPGQVVTPTESKRGA
jgi:membrane fusion protein (multidrug efflux system)